MNAFILQGSITFIKDIDIDIFNYKRFLFQINAVLFSFLFITKKCSKNSITVFNSDNNKKCYLIVTLKTGELAAENLALWLQECFVCVCVCVC